MFIYLWYLHHFGLPLICKTLKLALLQDLTLKCDNTWAQYWPKIYNLVAWLKHNAVVNSGEDTLITEGKFLQFEQDLKTGVCTTYGRLL